MNSLLRNTLAVIGFIVVVLIIGVCAACGDDGDESTWGTELVASSEPPGGRDGPGREGECDGSCDNENGNDCYQASAECSDDDAVIICAVPDACRF